MQVRVNLSTPTVLLGVCQKHETKMSIDVELFFANRSPAGLKIVPMRCPEGETSCTDDWVLEVDASTSDVVITQ